MSNLGAKAYGFVLHGLLIALAVTTVVLAVENRELRGGDAPFPSESRLIAGEALGAFEFTDLDGKPRRLELADSEGKEHLFFFFTTTCPICVENQPRWKDLYGRLGGAAEVLAVSFDPPESTRAYAERMDLPFPVLVVADPNAFAREYELNGVPFTLQVAAGGRVRDSWLGPLSERDLRQILSVFPVLSGG